MMSSALQTDALPVNSIITNIAKIKGSNGFVQRDLIAKDFNQNSTEYQIKKFIKSILIPWIEDALFLL